MRFLAWLCVTNFVSEIEIKFMVVGHTYFSVDANFGHIKRKYRCSNAYIIEHLANIISESAASNEAVVLSHKKIFNFTSALSQYFAAIPKIANKHYFKFTSDNPWTALVKSNLDADWKEVSLIKKNTPGNEKAKLSARIKLLKCLPPVGVSTEKKVDFHDKIRVFVPEEFKSVLCPKPSEIERAEAKMARAKKRKQNSKKLNLVTHSDNISLEL